MTEVVIALGIFAISMVGILALFPVASATGRESSEETQAAILAQTILCDLRNSAARRGATNAYLIRGTDTSKDWIDSIKLTEAKDFIIAYDIKVRDRADSKGGSPQIGPPIALKALAETASAAYTNGVTNLPTARYLAQVQIRPDAVISNLASVIVQISLPPDQPLTNRRTFTFPTLVFGP